MFYSVHFIDDTVFYLYFSSVFGNKACVGFFYLGEVVFMYFGKIQFVGNEKLFVTYFGVLIAGNAGSVYVIMYGMCL